MGAMFQKARDAGLKRHEEKRQQLDTRMQEMKDRLKKLDLPESQLLSLTDLSLTELQTKLRQNEVRPVDLLHAFQLKAMKLYENGNSGICEFIADAEEQAEKLSAAKSQASELYGIPVSVKELCNIRGYDSTFGLFKRCLMPAEDDCPFIKALKEAGAIPFVLTATSQLALTISGYNPVFGDMTNPYSELHEPGGSSSGEAILLAQNGSPIGIGTDVAGSIRIPSAFCGLVGLKPTSQRFGYRHSKNLFTGSVVAVQVAVGPMGKCVEDLAKFMRTLLRRELFHLDPSIPPLPFNDSLYRAVSSQKLKIGYYDNLIHSNLVQTVPAVRRGVQKAVEMLKQAGHELIRFDPPDLLTALKLGFSAMLADGGQEILNHMKNEPLNDHSKNLVQMANVPCILRNTFDGRIRKTIGNPPAVLHMIKKLSNVVEVIHLIKAIENYRIEFVNAMAQMGDLDVLICPVWPFPAPKLTTPAYIISPAVLYTFLYNLLDFPAGVVPIGFVNDHDIEQTYKLAEEFKGLGDSYHVNVMLSQHGSKGLPLSVQVVGKPYQDELVLGVMKSIESGKVADD